MKHNPFVPKRIYRLRLTMFALLTIALLALIFTAAAAVYFYNQQHVLSSRYYNLKILAQDIALHDEILTMSTFAATHDNFAKWKERYDQYESSLEQLLAKAESIDPKIAQFIVDTASANERLVVMEKQAFDLTSMGRQSEALSVLTSAEYQMFKAAFSTGIANAIEEVLGDTQSSLDESNEARGRYLVWSMVFSFILVLILWYQLIRYVRLTERAIDSKARIDDLSGLLNRREFDRVFVKELNRAQREHLCLMVAVLDLDNFKFFNDRYGHQKGDEVIKQVGGVLQQLSRRANESVFRVGGEEFVFLSTCESQCEGRHRCQTICSEICELNIEHMGNPDHHRVTVSCGIAFSDKQSIMTTMELYSRADQALYRAKSTGKNRFVEFSAVS